MRDSGIQGVPRTVPENSVAELSPPLCTFSGSLRTSAARGPRTGPPPRAVVARSGFPRDAAAMKTTAPVIDRNGHVMEPADRRIPRRVTEDEIYDTTYSGG